MNSASSNPYISPTTDLDRSRVEFSHGMSTIWLPCWLVSLVTCVATRVYVFRWNAIDDIVLWCRLGVIGMIVHCLVRALTSNHRLTSAVVSASVLTALTTIVVDLASHWFNASYSPQEILAHLWGIRAYFTKLIGLVAVSGSTTAILVHRVAHVRSEPTRSKRFLVIGCVVAAGFSGIVTACTIATCINHYSFPIHVLPVPSLFILFSSGVISISVFGFIGSLLDARSDAKHDTAPTEVATEH